MKNIFILMVIAMPISGCSSPENDPADPKTVCWIHTTHHVEGVANTLNLCLQGRRGSVLVEYPNAGHNPTTCFQEGEKQSTPDGFELILREGACKNGRSLSSNTLACAKNGQGIICSDIDGYEFDFEKSHKN